MTKEMMLRFAAPLLQEALQKAARVQVKDMVLTCGDDIPTAVERCWHDAMSDLDVEVWGIAAGELLREMKLLGASVQGNVLRFVTEEGFRGDLICHDGSAEIDGADSFWFVAVQVLGKLLRRDYLISAHLSHMLLMETLVTQMVQRDEKYQTNHHRYGYAEALDYRQVDVSPYADLIEGDETYACIAEQLIRAALCRANAEKFIAIWRGYLVELQT